MTGLVVAEGLVDSRVVNGWLVLDAKISGHDNPADRWHLYRVELTDDQIDALEHQLRPGWYAHFWAGRTITAVFSGRRFVFDADDGATWSDVLAYGRAAGIPDEQLDFPIVD